MTNRFSKKQILASCTILVLLAIVIFVWVQFSQGAFINKNQYATINITSAAAFKNGETKVATTAKHKGSYLRRPSDNCKQCRASSEDKLWDEIGQEMHIKGEEAKKRWKNLRDTYVRFIRINKTKTGQAAKQSKKWQWSDHMEAFRPFLTFAKTSSNVPEYINETESTEELNDVNDDTQDTSINQATETCDFSGTQENNDVTHADRSDDNTTPSSRTLKKQKTTKSSTTKPTSSVESIITYFENKKTSGSKDDLDLLFLSYARTIKKFSGRRQAETKLQIAQIIAQQEIMHYKEQSQQQVLKPYVDVSRPSTSNSCNSNFNSYVSSPLISPNSGDENHQTEENSAAD